MVFPMFSSNAGGAPSSLDFGNTASALSTATLTNAGNTEAWPYVVFAGPAPSFSIVIDGNTVTYNQPIPAGQTVTIDYATGLATLSGGVDRTAQLTARNFSSVTSSSQVTLSASSGTATITVADMWR
jgi:phage-related protein